MRRIKALGFISDGLRIESFIGLTAIFLAAVFVLGMTVTAKAFEDVAVNIEVNATDGDAGVQIFLDGDPWKRARVKGPNGNTVYSVSARGKLKKFGYTENFTESNEPNFVEEMTLPEILEFLPEGEYTFDGRTIENEKLEGTAELTHDLPCGPGGISPALDAVLDPTMPVMISWDAVVNKINTDTDEGDCDVTDFDITIIAYEVIVENESTEDPTEKFTIKVPASVLKVTLPEEFIIPDSEYKFEILAIEESGNQTITESFFSTSE